MGSYIVRADLEARYDAKNVLLWADPGSYGDTAAITARITLAIAIAEDYFTSRMRKTGSSFNLPMLDSTGAVPYVIKDIIVKQAGYWLSTCHGVRDYDEKEGKPMTRLYVDYVDSENKIKQIIGGELVLDVL